MKIKCLIFFKDWQKAYDAAETREIKQRCELTAEIWKIYEFTVDIRIKYIIIACFNMP